MKVRELARELERMDPEATVAVESCDGCLVYPDRVSKVHALLDRSDNTVGLLGGHR